MILSIFYLGSKRGMFALLLGILTMAVSAFGSGLNGGAANQGGAGITGEYSVPVRKELEPFSRYPVSGISWSIVSEKVKLEYALPAELTGLPDSCILLTGQDKGLGTFKLDGPKGAANCFRDGSPEAQNVKCFIRYGDLQMKFGPAAQLLADRYTDTNELLARLNVTIQFQKEGEGIISFNVANPALPQTPVAK